MNKKNAAAASMAGGVRPSALAVVVGAGQTHLVVTATGTLVAGRAHVAGLVGALEGGAAHLRSSSLLLDLKI
jgi:hypothetical protein